MHLQGSARLGVFKIRVADTFLSTERGTYLYWRDTLGTLNFAQLPEGAYTGLRLAAWISSNVSSTTYIESRNELEVAYDGSTVPRKRQLPRGRDTQQGSEHKPPSRPQLCQRSRQPASRCSLCADAAVLGGVPALQQPGQCRRHCGPCWATTSSRRSSASRASATSWRRIRTRTTWSMSEARSHCTRYLRFRLTDYEGNAVDLRGTSLSPSPPPPDMVERAAAPVSAPAAVAEPPEPPLEEPEPPPTPAQMRIARQVSRAGSNLPI